MTDRLPGLPSPLDEEPEFCVDCKLAHLDWRVKRASVALMESAMDHEDGPSLEALREIGHAMTALIDFMDDHPERIVELSGIADLHYVLASVAER